MSPERAFSSERLRGRVRDKAQHAIAEHIEPGEQILAMVPGIAAGTEPKRRSMLPRAKRRMVVATDRNVYVFAYRFGRLREAELKRELGGLPVSVNDDPRGAGSMTVGDLTLHVGASVWRDWRDEARRVVEMNYGGRR